jgi:transcription initiation factor TFIID subunit 9B
VILSSLGIHSYQERVPLQLLDFAYRYTSGILSDSLRLSAEGYTSQADRGNRRGATDDSGAITIQALRQAIASRQGYTFQGPLAKEFMMEQAAERNRIALPRIDRSLSMQLPPEKYCLTGVGWNMKEEWDSDEDLLDEDAQPPAAAAATAANKEDEQMGGIDGEAEDEDEEGAGRMEDVFGADSGGDTNMTQD